MGLGLVMIYVLIGDPFHVYHEDVFQTEHDLARTFSGTAYVLGMQAMVISCFLWLEKKKIYLNIPIITWVGVNSLLIFALHRILFIKVIVMWGSVVGRTIGASIVETFTYIFLTLGFCYLIKKTRIADIIVHRS
jgi:fucose 4-O-acetylase-like acetyltransferase